MHATHPFPAASGHRLINHNWPGPMFWSMWVALRPLWASLSLSFRPNLFVVLLIRHRYYLEVGAGGSPGAVLSMLRTTRRIPDRSITRTGFSRPRFAEIQVENDAHFQHNAPRKLAGAGVFRHQARGSPWLAPPSPKNLQESPCPRSPVPRHR
jgi:hypothetical protein